MNFTRFSYKEKRHIHVTRIKDFQFSTTAHPLDIVRRDYLEFHVEEIPTQPAISHTRHTNLFR